MASAVDEARTAELAGLRVAVVGRLAGMLRRDVQQLIRQRGGAPVQLPNAANSQPSGEIIAGTDDRRESNSSEVHLIVVGEDVAVSADPGTPDFFDEATRTAIEAGQVEVIGESEFWQRLGLVDDEQNIRRLYTPAMLAELIGVPVAVVRRWHRRGLIQPVREVRRLPYFDFQEVATARRLAELLAGGVSPAAIERKLTELARYVPDVQRPLAQLSVIVRGSRLLLRQGDGLIGPGGQLFFDFDSLPPEAGASAAAKDSAELHPRTISFAEALRAPAAPISPDELLTLAADLEDEGNLAAAVEAYRAYTAAAGPSASVCFAVAELLYRLGDVAAARERYYMAIELDEDLVEARANLGCVLAELGERELAVAALEGALTMHADYADAHFHLARTLDELQRDEEAMHHWREFLRLAPESPWAAAARQRLKTAEKTP
ncbi:MAG TPA: MerR family transcriptional regulator [Pirellulales bacterium]|jgi:tetratricopeptide (TPR) repeat protein|nr:MerR family transcriptional regulator [Pirellulales bacterium]